MIFAKPLLTEKTYRLGEASVYAFRVPKDLDKPQIAGLIARQYGVTVKEVRTVMMASKTKRVGKTRQEVRLPKWKKAYVLLASGQKLDLYPAQEAQPVVADKE